MERKILLASADKYRMAQLDIRIRVRRAIRRAQGKKLEEARISSLAEQSSRGVASDLASAMPLTEVGRADQHY